MQRINKGIILLVIYSQFTCETGERATPSNTILLEKWLRNRNDIRHEGSLRLRVVSAADKSCLLLWRCRSDFIVLTVLPLLLIPSVLRLL